MESFQPGLKICLITWTISDRAERWAEIERGVSETFPTVSEKNKFAEKTREICKNGY